MGRRGAAMLAALLFSGGALKAQRSFAVGVGADIPIGTTADQLKSGYHTVASFSFRPSLLKRAVRLDYAVSELHRSDSASTAHRIQWFTLDLVASGPSRLTPTGYVVAGIGSYQQTSGGARSSDLGLNVGAGINFPRAVAGWYVEARLHYIGGESRTKFFPLTFGLVFQ